MLLMASSLPHSFPFPSWKPIVDNIEARFDAFLEQENRVNRLKVVDNRVHACIYFIQPTGHSLKPIDIKFMTELHEKVNLIPVIAKSDTLTDDEIKAFKARVSGRLWNHVASSELISISRS